ncbi:uncharacterized protein LOC129589017 [Paramacrobiotus metropolitanus]|uniref:uncharacterized protein LOC129589017 n=1 Tax=Paramacrobiotus metropolitanus TaxID=2943436 RepID=UPI00244610EF|nr:uncharacterized protein LOC129589017 [Paramacrobiotus metropolitanus]
MTLAISESPMLHQPEAPVRCSSGPSQHHKSPLIGHMLLILVAMAMERSRQSARECRARKKLRYQYLSDLIQDREGTVDKLQSELSVLERWAQQIDQGTIPPELHNTAPVPFSATDTISSVNGAFNPPALATTSSIFLQRTPVDHQFSADFISTLFEPPTTTAVVHQPNPMPPYSDTMAFFRLP